MSFLQLVLSLDKTIKEIILFWRICQFDRYRHNRQQELDRVQSKSRKWSKSRKQSKSHRRSKSNKRSKSHGHDEGGAHGKHEVPKPGVWMSQCKEEESGQSPSSTTQQDKRHAEQLAPSSERSKFLTGEVVKHAQSYI